MIKLSIALLLMTALIFLVRRNLVRVDCSFPLFVAIVILGFAANSDQFIDGLAAGLGIIYAPLAIVLLGLFIVLALVTALSVSVSHMRQNQIALFRRLAEIDLEAQELRRSTGISEKWN
jgi:hypothetical protein